MDLTQDYILMCEKAQDIQEVFDNGGCLVNVELGNFYYNLKNKLTYCIGNYDDLDNESHSLYAVGSYSAIFLPRQDQLQDMVLEEIYGGRCFDLHLNFGIKIVEEEKIYKTSYSSEQLWLAFVMKEKYNKQWNFETKEWEVVK